MRTVSVVEQRQTKTGGYRRERQQTVELRIVALTHQIENTPSRLFPAWTDL